MKKHGGFEHNRHSLRIVEEIDVGGSGQHMWIEPVHNGTSQELAKRVNELFDLGTPAAPGAANAKANGLNKVIADDTRRVVRRVLDDLSERDRGLLRAVFLEERDKDEVCTELGVDRDYLRVLLHRAKGSFREVYSKKIDGKTYH